MFDLITKSQESVNLVSCLPDVTEVSEEMFPSSQEWNPNMKPQQRQDQLFRQIKEEEMDFTATLEAAPSDCVKQL